MPEGSAALGRNRWFPGMIRPKKECIKSCETCFAKNALNLNDKGPSIKWVCFPKFYGPLANWLWLRISPHSSLNVIYCLIITAWQWLMSFACILCKLNPIKAHWGTGSRPFTWEIGHLVSPNRSCPGRLILIRGGQGWGALWLDPPTTHYSKT